MSLKLLLSHFCDTRNDMSEQELWTLENAKLIRTDGDGYYVTTAGAILLDRIPARFDDEHQAAQQALNEQTRGALDMQIGGDHYKKLGAYQPWEVLAHWLTPEELRGYMKGTVIAYLARERDKGGDDDIAKAFHTGQLWKEVRGKKL
jgi:hypothetical protein